MNDDFDLSRYFSRIRYQGQAEPTLDVLRALHLLHPQAIPFENLNPYTGARVRLDLPSIATKLVEQRRGGYCFEQNKLLHAALTRIGFRVTPLIARVRWQLPPEASSAQTHMLLRIELDGATWFADVGFGSATLTAPLRHVLNEEQHTPHGSFRLVAAPVDGELESEYRTPGGWQTVYRFSLKPVEWIDYEMANWFTSTYPDSIFLRELIICRILPEARASLVNDTLTLRDLDGHARTTRLADTDAWAACLHERFGIDTAGFDTAALFAKVKVRGDEIAAADHERMAPGGV